MIKNVRIFFCFVVLGFITPATLGASAAPMTADVGKAAVTLVLSPDPPVTGHDAATILVTGVEGNLLKSTQVRFASAMPSMRMNGPAGAARNIGLGQWTFDLNLAMAAPWDVRLSFSGGMSGSATFHVAVANAQSSNSSALPAMSTGGDWSAWRTAAFVLVGLGLIAIVVLRRDRRTGTIALFAAAAVIVIGIAMMEAQYVPAPMDMNAMENVAGSAPVAVRTIRVGPGRRGGYIIAPGTVSPYLTQTIVARASGLLSDFNVYNGDKVQAGQQIAYLSEPELGSSAAAAQAAAQAAQIEAMHHAPNDVRMAQNDIAAKQREAQYWSQEIARERVLLGEGAVSQQEYQNEAAQAASAQADLRNAIIKASDAAASVGQARAQYSQAQNVAQTQSILASYRAVIAPDDAVMVKRLVDPGTYVQAGTSIAQVAVLDRLRVQASVAQRDLSEIGLGDPVDAALPNGTVVHGRVSSIQPVADSATHTAIVEAIVENPHDRLQPGGYVRVSIHARSTTSTGVSIPASAIVGGANGSIVYILKDGTAQPVPVRVLSNDGVTAVVRGLSRNADVITEGAADIQPGQAVSAGP
jgi:HlyD family secretion protein